MIANVVLLGGRVCQQSVGIPLCTSASLQTVSNAFSKSTKAQNNFFFLLFKISKNENNVKILSVVDYDFLNPNWFSSNKKTSFENTRSLSSRIAVNSLPRQLIIVIGGINFYYII